MDFQTLCFSFVLCSTVMLCGTKGTDPKPEEGGLDFTQAIQAINTQKGESDNINYDTFCQTTVDIVHDQLFDCQLQAPNSGFELRVCKLETGCEELVKSSIDFHDSVLDAELSVVRYSKTKITDLRCKEENNPVKNTCTGYVEEWIDTAHAKLVKFNEKVFKKTEDEMISDIKNYQTTPEAKATTVTDLQKIMAWMTPPDGQCTMYKQLCDLEGFFKKTGGFVIINPNINYKMMLSDYCHSGEGDPTNERVLAVLKKFIKELSPAEP